MLTTELMREIIRELFRDLGILTLHSQYILSLVMFVSKNMNDFTTNSDIHPCNTRNNNNLHPPLTRLTKYQKGAYYSGIKAYNCLPTEIKQLSRETKKFKKALKKFLLTGSFYSIEEMQDWTLLKAP